MMDLREFLKDDVRAKVRMNETDQSRGVPMPPVQKPLREGETAVPLPQWRGAVKLNSALEDLIGARRSLRKFADEPLSAEELSFLLWATQGVREKRGERVLRNVPSAGNRHTTENYVALTRDVADANGNVAFQKGIWRYLPLDHALVFQGCPENVGDRVTQAALFQAFVGSAPVIFFWACIPYRMEWRYAVASHKVIALDAGHICQNLYLAAESIGCGTCAIAAYNQSLADELLGVDGKEEFVIYLAPVGRNPYK